MSKYGSTRSGGFQSKLEEAVHNILLLRQIAGEIRILRTQENVHLTDARILYIPDFSCEWTKTGENLFVEAKGFDGPRWPTIKKLWKFYGPGSLEIWKGTYKSPQLVETIIPKSAVQPEGERT